MQNGFVVRLKFRGTPFSWGLSRLRGGEREARADEHTSGEDWRRLSLEFGECFPSPKLYSREIIHLLLVPFSYQLLVSVPFKEILLILHYTVSDSMYHPPKLHPFPTLPPRKRTSMGKWQCSLLMKLLWAPSLMTFTIFGSFESLLSALELQYVHSEFTQPPLMNPLFCQPAPLSVDIIHEWFFAWNSGGRPPFNFAPSPLPS